MFIFFFLLLKVDTHAKENFSESKNENESMQLNIKSEINQAGTMSNMNTFFFLDFFFLFFSSRFFFFFCYKSTKIHKV